MKVFYLNMYTGVLLSSSLSYKLSIVKLLAILIVLAISLLKVEVIML